MRALAKFEKKFCQLMHGGEDFTLRLELRGNKSNLLHARIYTDESERTPASAGV